MSSGDEDDGERGIAETSPNGRFVRYNKVLGAGAFKTVYAGSDEENGTDIAWNVVRLDRLSKEDKQVVTEVRLLSQLRHENILNFLWSWVDLEKNQVIFITELMTSGTLKNFLTRAKPFKLRIIKRWLRQILRGLRYLHECDPPIIHRDLKCDNIFVNGNLGEVKIGDMGLSTIRRHNHAISVIGTPEFMAPELYDEQYDERVDIYAFGMCMLEMITQSYPYSECENAAQIFKKVSSRTPPRALDMILDPEVKAFVAQCLGPPEQRLSAAELLEHPFLNTESERDNEPVRLKPKAPKSNMTTAPPVPPQPGHDDYAVLTPPHSQRGRSITNKAEATGKPVVVASTARSRPTTGTKVVASAAAVKPAPKQAAQPATPQSKLQQQHQQHQQPPHQQQQQQQQPQQQQQQQQQQQVIATPPMAMRPPSRQQQPQSVRMSPPQLGDNVTSDQDSGDGSGTRARAGSAIELDWANKTVATISTGVLDEITVTTIPASPIDVPADVTGGPRGGPGSVSLAVSSSPSPVPVFDGDEGLPSALDVFPVDPVAAAAVADEATEAEVELQLRLQLPDALKEIKFNFNLDKDTPEQVAQEMVTELDLPENVDQEIVEHVEALVSRLREGEVVTAPVGNLGEFVSPEQLTEPAPEPAPSEQLQASQQASQPQLPATRPVPVPAAGAGAAAPTPGRQRQSPPDSDLDVSPLGASLPPVARGRSHDIMHGASGAGTAADAAASVCYSAPPLQSTMKRPPSPNPMMVRVGPGGGAAAAGRDSPGRPATPTTLPPRAASRASTASTSAAAAAAAAAAGRGGLSVQPSPPRSRASSRSSSPDRNGLLSGQLTLKQLVTPESEDEDPERVEEIFENQRSMLSRCQERERRAMTSRHEDAQHELEAAFQQRHQAAIRRKLNHEKAAAAAAAAAAVENGVAPSPVPTTRGAPPPPPPPPPVRGAQRVTPRVTPRPTPHTTPTMAGTATTEARHPVSAAGAAAGVIKAGQTYDRTIAITASGSVAGSTAPAHGNGSGAGGTAGAAGAPSSFGSNNSMLSNPPVGAGGNQRPQTHTKQLNKRLAEKKASIDLTEMTGSLFNSLEGGLKTHVAEKQHKGLVPKGAGAGGNPAMKKTLLELKAEREGGPGTPAALPPANLGARQRRVGGNYSHSMSMPTSTAAASSRGVS